MGFQVVGFLDLEGNPVGQADSDGGAVVGGADGDGVGRARGEGGPRGEKFQVFGFDPAGMPRGEGHLGFLALPAGGDEACSRIGREKFFLPGPVRTGRVPRTGPRRRGAARSARKPCLLAGANGPERPPSWYSTAESEEDSSWPIRREPS